LADAGKQRGDLDAAHRQLLLHAGPLGNRPLLVVPDIARIVIRTNFANAVTERHGIPLAELTDPLRLRLLKWLFSVSEQLRPAHTRQALTVQATGEHQRSCATPLTRDAAHLDLSRTEGEVCCTSLRRSEINKINGLCGNTRQQSVTRNRPARGVDTPLDAGKPADAPPAWKKSTRWTACRRSPSLSPLSGSAR